MDADAIIVIGLKLLLVVFLVALNGFFVAAEFAIVKIRDTQLVGLVAAGNRRAKMARVLLSNLDASLSATQLGITLASLGLGWVGEPVFASLLAPAMEWLHVESEQMRHTISFVICTLWRANWPPSPSRSRSRCQRRSGWRIHCAGFTSPRIRSTGRSTARRSGCCGGWDWKR
jgi:hypothetical protein